MDTEHRYISRKKTRLTLVMMYIGIAAVILGSLLAVFSVWAVNKLYARFAK